MKNNLIHSTAALLVMIMLLAGFSTGCRKNGDDVSSLDNSLSVNTSDLSESYQVESNSSVSSSNISSSGAVSSSTPSSTTSTKPKKDTAVRDLGGRTIKFMAIWEEPKKGSTTMENIYWKKKTEVEKKYNVKFKHVYATGDWYSTYLTSVMSGSPSADIISCREDPYPAIKNGLFYDLSKLDEFDFTEDKWDPAYKALGTVNGKMYLMLSQKFQSRNVVLYNKDTFAKYGVEDLYTLQKNGKLTLDKLIEIATKISKATNKPAIYGGINVFDVYTQFAYAYGGQFITRQSDTLKFQSTFNSTAVVNGFNRAQTLLNDKVMFDGTGASGWTWVREQFYKGAVPIALDVTITPYFTNSNFNVGLCAMPTVSGGVVDTFSDVNWVAMSANTKKPDDVALIWDQMTDVIFEVNYRNLYLDILSKDAMEFVDAQSKRQVAGSSKVDYYFTIDIWNDGVGTTLEEMTQGKITPAQAVQTVGNVIANKVKSY